jgi:hypothetical protein
MGSVQLGTNRHLRRIEVLIHSFALAVFLAMATSGFGDTGADRTWAEAMAACRRETAADPQGTPRTVLKDRLAQLAEVYPLEQDWWLQDTGGDLGIASDADGLSGWSRRLASRAIEELGEHGASSRRGFEALLREGTGAGDARWLELYRVACQQRRAQRLASLVGRWPQMVFTKHYNLGGSHYAYTEGQSDAQNERTFVPGSALCLLDWDEVRFEGRIRTLLEDPEGVIRDPDVSWDGGRVLFSWKKADRTDDYHLYELEVKSGRVRQLTDGLGFADYEGAYLPDGSIVFNSTRCVQTVDCWWTEVSNLYACDRDGGRIRRLTFDQVHDNYPTVLPDGRLIYTRWEYNDRGQIFVQGLFQMNPDGTGQTEFYGNNSWFPTSILHARGIPGSTKVVAIFSGHHTLQAGKLGLLDPACGRQENTGAQLIAPVRGTPAARIDAYGQDGDLFQYPYPLSESEFVVAYAPRGWAVQPTRFGLFWMARDGRRELLWSDRDLSCCQPVPLAARPLPPARPSRVDYSRADGTIYLEDVYAGPGLAGIARGTVRSLRVVALDYRAAGLGWNYNHGPAGDALISTPVALGNGTWDVKVVLGEARVHSDGSAFFKVPARRPVYFQAIDTNGFAIQTMRSWTTLQPGENAACVGCHESKNATPSLARAPSVAMRAGPQELAPFHGPARGFSFRREIQPILDRHCVRCHPGPDSAIDLRDTPVVEALAKRRWSASYLTLINGRDAALEGNRYLAGHPNTNLNWISAQSAPGLLPPYSAGAARSRWLGLLREGHRGAVLDATELETLACWIDLLVPFCGDYTEANTWTAEEAERYEHFRQKREAMAAGERRSIEALVTAGSSASTRPNDRP